MAGSGRTQSESAGLLAYIEQLQAQAYARLNDTEKMVVNADPALKKKSHEKLVERILEAHYRDQPAPARRKIRAELKKGLDSSRVRSPFSLQDRGHLHMLQRYVAMIRKHAPDSRLAKAPTPLLATLPTPYLNAFSAKHPAFPGEAVVFNEALMTFLFLLAKIVARFFPAQFVEGRGFYLLFDRGATNRLFAADFVSRTLFDKLICGLVYDANPFARTDPYLLPQGSTFVANNLLAYAELFVFAHELSHIALGHHDETRHSRLEWMDSQLLELDTEKADEFAADAEALSCLMAMIDDVFKAVADPAERLTHTYWGIDLFFKALELSSNAVTLAKFGYEAQIVDHAHPSAAQRREALHNVVRGRFPGFNAKLGCPNWEVAVYPGDWLGYLIDAMWKELKPKIAAMHAAGVAVSPRWDDLTEAQVERV